MAMLRITRQSPTEAEAVIEDHGIHRVATLTDGAVQWQDGPAPAPPAWRTHVTEQAEKVIRTGKSFECAFVGVLRIERKDVADADV